MTYHKDCRAKGSPLYGYPVKCELHNGKTGMGVYVCPACQQTWVIGDNDSLPDGLTEETKHPATSGREGVRRDGLRR